MGHARAGAVLGQRILQQVVKQYGGKLSASPAVVAAEGSIGARLSRPTSFTGPLSQQVIRLSCCARLDLPPPREIVVEYQEKPETTDFFIQLANEIESEKPDLSVVENPDDMQPRDGSFEVTSGQHVLFSKLRMNRLPRVDEILLAIDQLPTTVLSCEVDSSEVDSSEEKAATA